MVSFVRENSLIVPLACAVTRTVFTVSYTHDSIICVRALTSYSIVSGEQACSEAAAAPWTALLDTWYAAMNIYN